MTRDWKPGDVAVGDSGKRIFRHGEVWITAHPGLNAAKVAPTWEHTDARPLVVIDPEDRDEVERFTYAFLAHHWSGGYETHTDAGQAALREFADPTPTIAEPRNLLAVVADDKGVRWYRWTKKALWPWRVVGGTVGVDWAEVAAVSVIHDGFEDDE